MSRGCVRLIIATYSKINRGVHSLARTSTYGWHNNMPVACAGLCVRVFRARAAGEATKERVASNAEAAAHAARERAEQAEKAAREMREKR